MNIKAVLWIAVGVLIAIFVFQNTAIVEVRLFFWTVTLSRVLLLGAAILLGFFGGLAAGWEWFGKKKRAAGKPASSCAIDIASPAPGPGASIALDIRK